MPYTSLPVNVDTTYPDSGTDASVKVHQQHHDTIHATLNTGTLVLSSVQSASYTLAMADEYKAVEFTGSTAQTLTVPTNAAVAFPIGTLVEVCRIGTGAVTVAGASGVTIRSRDNLLAPNGQYAVASLRKRAANEWVLAGDLV